MRMVIFFFISKYITTELILLDSLLKEVVDILSPPRTLFQKGRRSIRYCFVLRRHQNGSPHEQDGRWPQQGVAVVMPRPALPNW